MTVLNQIPNESGGFGPHGSSPTKEDYETAKRLMPILGSSLWMRMKSKLTGGGLPEEEYFYKLDSIKGFETLYRGIDKLKQTRSSTE